MLPSDHFVRMYNELFKLLEESGRDNLYRYWLEIAALQEVLMQPFLANQDFAGLYAYWEHIRVEENADMELRITDAFFEIIMNKCPSLTKNIDNDAGLSLNYCEHCAGWIHPVLRKHGFFPVYDIISPREPRCRLRVYREKQSAQAYAETVVHLWDPYNDLE